MRTQANESPLTAQSETHGDLLRRVDFRIEAAHGVKCLARAEKETAEGHAHLLRKPHFNGDENSEVGGNASAVANGAATSNSSSAHRFDSGAHRLRSNDGVGVNEDEQITLRLARTRVARHGNLSVLYGDDPCAVLMRDLRRAVRGTVVCHNDL